MGFVDWLKRTFGKQPCAFCGAEVGMLKRTKIKNKEFICSDCRRTCSQYIDVYRFTKEELLGHMEYIRRQGLLYASLQTPTLVVMGSGSHEGIEFYDEVGMFRIRNTDTDDRYPKELIRYDQVAGYAPFCHENEPEEQGKPKTFEECGITISFVGQQPDAEQARKGLRTHPYIFRDLEVVINKQDKHTGMLQVQQIIHKFNTIFGVNDDTGALFGFGPTRQQRRTGEALAAMGGLFAEAIRTAKEGGEVTEETKAQFEDAMHKADDASTHGLAKYSRLADEAEAKVQ